KGFELLDTVELVTDVPAVIRAWQRGTVIRSWLLDLLVRALDSDPELDDLRGYVEDSGEGRWTVAEAINHAVPAPVISAALFARFRSRQDDSPAMRAVAALRNRGPVPRPRDVLGILRTVLFAPEDLALVRGDPGERRRFLDDLLVLRAPRYAGVRADYERVLKQRNALLKSSGAARRAGSK